MNTQPAEEFNNERASYEAEIHRLRTALNEIINHEHVRVGVSKIAYEALRTTHNDHEHYDE